jgi:hypothetical protein
VAVMPDMTNLVIQITGHNTHYNFGQNHTIDWQTGL